jgi:glycosyltransferase involved in cell wall biosynthesis
MRVGVSPNRFEQTDRRPARVTVCIVVHIPNQLGYYAQRLDVLRLSLASLLKHTPPDLADVFIFDNGSCPEAVNALRALRDRGLIRYLLLSAENVGTVNAYQILFRAAPGEIIAYSDDDVLFHPGWLEASLEVLDAFPHVGLVSATPVREQFRYGNEYLASYLDAHRDIEIRRGRFTPDEWQEDFGRSLGHEPVAYLATLDHYEEILLTCHGVRAYSTATHFQYIAHKDIILSALPSRWDERLMVGPHQEIDERIDRMGYARLSTERRYVQHLGNVIERELLPDLATLGLHDIANVFTPPSAAWRALARSTGIPTAFRKIWNATYFARNFRRS